MRVIGSRANGSPGFDIIKIDGAVLKTACPEGELRLSLWSSMLHCPSFFISYNATSSYQTCAWVSKEPLSIVSPVPHICCHGNKCGRTTHWVVSHLKLRRETVTWTSLFSLAWEESVRSPRNGVLLNTEFSQIFVTHCSDLLPE